MALEVNIKKKIGKFHLHVQLRAEKGSHVGILGASGCGKSMTLKCIAGIMNPDEGRIVLDGKVLFDSALKINLTPQRRKVGYLFQNYALFPNMTVAKNIAIGISRDKDKNRKKEIIKALILKFHLDELEDRYPSELSGGQQQRVALARMLASEPDIIMLDEPFSALDSFLKEELQREMYDTLKDYDGEVLMVSHSRDEIFKLTQQLAIMDRGKIVTYNETRAIFEDPKYLEAARLTGCKNISRAVKTGDFQINAIDWNITLKTVKKVQDVIAYVGIRAHHIEITKSKTVENGMEVNVLETSEMPFDMNYIVKNSIESNQELWIRLSKGDVRVGNDFCDMKRIVLPPEKLLLLK